MNHQLLVKQKLVIGALKHTESESGFCFVEVSSPDLSNLITILTGIFGQNLAYFPKYMKRMRTELIIFYSM